MRPAVWRFGLCVALASCWSDTHAGRGALDNHAKPQPRELAGAYSCSINDGYQYPPFRCTIRKIGARLVLAKLGGSQRFEGEIRPTGDGFTFDGRFYCPWGDCTQELHGAFAPAPDAMREGALRGTFRDAQLVVLLVPDAGDGFGGSEYGGSYGGSGYGGASYGHPNRIRR